MRHGSDPLARYPSDRMITGVRYLVAIRTASSAVSKQSDGVEGASTGTGDSPFLPYRTISRSACSVLVGMPVDGPARWMSQMISGSSTETARPIVSILSVMPGPEVVLTPRPPRRGHQAVGEGEVAGDVAVRARLEAGRLDLVLDRERLGGLAVVPAGLERRDVRLHDLGLAGELGLQELDGPFHRPVVEPGEQAEGEHVLGPLGFLAADL